MDAGHIITLCLRSKLDNTEHPKLFLVLTTMRQLIFGLMLAWYLSLSQETSYSTQDQATTTRRMMTTWPYSWRCLVQCQRKWRCKATCLNITSLEIQQVESTTSSAFTTWFLLISSNFLFIVTCSSPRKHICSLTS